MSNHKIISSTQVMGRRTMSTPLILAGFIAVSAAAADRTVVPAKPDNPAVAVGTQPAHQVRRTHRPVPAQTTTNTIEQEPDVFDQIVGEFTDERAAAFEETYPLLRNIGRGLAWATLLGVLTAIGITIKRAREAMGDYNRKVATTDAIGDYEAVLAARQAYDKAHQALPAELARDEDASVLDLHERFKADEKARLKREADYRRLKAQVAKISPTATKQFATRLSGWKKLRYVVSQIFHKDEKPSFRLVLERQRKEGLKTGMKPEEREIKR